MEQVVSALAGGPSYDTVKFRNVGDTASGRIIDFADVQERDFNTKEPKFWDEAKTRPILQVRITLETIPGDKDSRKNLYVSGQRMRQAVKGALAASGASDISPQSKIAVQFTGFDGQAKTYTATYEPFDPTVGLAA
jgi:hypothetical protein